MAEEKKQVPKYVPNLNRKGVGDWSGGKSSNLIRYDDFGLYYLAFKRWHFIPGEKGRSYWACTAKVLQTSPISPPEMPAIEKDKSGAEKPQVDQKVFEAALKKCRFDPSLPGFKDAQGKDRSVFSPGVEATLLFSVNSPATAKQPDVDKIHEREDRAIKAFLEVVLADGLPKGVETDWNDVFAKLEEQGRVEHDSLTFCAKCVPLAKRNEISDPATGEVLKLSVVVNGNRYFDVWKPAAT